MTDLRSSVLVVALLWIRASSAEECQVLTQSCSSDTSHNYCLVYGMQSVSTGSYVGASCNTLTGRCECGCIDGYDAKTCLPDVNGCNMCKTNGVMQFDAAYPGFIDSGGSNMYYCFNEINDWDSLTNEIRAVGVYEASPTSGTGHVSGTINVNLRTCTDYPDLSKPVILLLSSYEPVDWVISSDNTYIVDNIDLLKVQAVAHHWQTTSIAVNGLSARNGTNVEYSYDSFSGGGGYGSDTGGGHVAKMLYLAPIVLGDFVYSFIGQYKAANIDVCVGDQNVTVMIPTQVTSLTSVPLTDCASPTTSTPTTTQINTRSATMAIGLCTGSICFCWVVVAIFVTAQRRRDSREEKEKVAQVDHEGEGGEGEGGEGEGEKLCFDHDIDVKS